MKKVVFLGAKKIGYECFKSLLEAHRKNKCEIVGVITRPTKLDGEETISDLCEKHNLCSLESLDEFLELPEVDITISIQHNQILSAKHINKASDVTINLHLAPLPEYRGCNQFSFAIIDEANWFGVTIHEINEEIDSGDILFERRFKIDNKDYWVKELYDKTIKAGSELFGKNIKDLLNSNYTKTTQKSLVKDRGTSIHYRNEIKEIKNIDLGWDKEKIERYVRATSMPGYEPPYTIINDRKVYFKA